VKVSDDRHEENSCRLEEIREQQNRFDTKLDRLIERRA